MRVNVSRKAMTVVTVCVLAVFAVIVARILYVLIQTSDYRKADARVISVDWEYDKYGSGENKIIHTVRFAYEADGTGFESEFTTLIKAGYREGKDITIYYNPDRPKELRPDMRPETVAAAGTMAMLILCIAMTIKADGAQ